MPCAVQYAALLSPPASVTVSRYWKVTGVAGMTTVVIACDGAAGAGPPSMGSQR